MTSEYRLALFRCEMTGSVSILFHDIVNIAPGTIVYQLVLPGDKLPVFCLAS